MGDQAICVGTTEIFLQNQCAIRVHSAAILTVFTVNSALWEIVHDQYPVSRGYMEQGGGGGSCPECVASAL